MIGERVSHFQVLEKLGEGGMGVVYKARDLNLDRIVALKFLPRQFTVSENDKERFYLEGRAASALNHPNITTIYEIQESEGQIFLAMEWVEGITLKQYLQKSIPSIPTIFDIAIQMCSGLAAAHRRGVVHRDIKADNILITPAGDVKITDFGLAKLTGASRLTAADSTVGTAAYMSPEQAQGEEVDERSDVFSCGVVLYELLTGRLPFRGDHHAAILYAVVNEEPIPIARYNEKVNPELERIVAKALAKDKEERYQHADEMLADLKRERKSLEHVAYEQTHKTVSSPAVPRPAVESTGHGSVPPLSPAADNDVAHSKTRKRLLRFLVPSAVLLILTLLLLTFNPFNLQTTLLKGNAAESERSLAVLYFQNIPDPEDKDHTGDMLTDLLTTALSQDKNLQVVSRERLYDIEKDMGQGDAKVIPPSMAQKLAERAGVSMMLIGSVLQRAPSLVVTARLVNVKNGNIVSSQRLSGYTGQQVFALVDTLALLVRSDLAEKAAPSPGSEAKPIAEVTTSSPEAYRLYLEGIERCRRFLVGDAKTAFTRAIALDSNFAMAYFWLGSRTMGDNFARRPLLKKARELGARVTEKERQQIEADYLDVVEGKPREAADVLERFVQKYPHEIGAYEQLAAIYFKLGFLEKNLQIYQNVLAKDSLDKETWNDLAYGYAGFNRKEEAFRAVNRYTELLPGEPNPYDTKGEIYVIFDEPDSAAIYFRKALTLRPDFQSGQKLGWKMMMDGDYRSAKSLFKQFGGSSDNVQNVRADLDETSITLHQGKFFDAEHGLSGSLSMLRQGGFVGLYTATLECLIAIASETDNRGQMVQRANELVAALKDQPEDLVNGRDLLALALQRKGDRAGAMALLDQIRRDVEGRGVINLVRYEQAAALSAMAEGKYGEAVGHFRSSYSLTYPNHSPVLSYGVALLKAGYIEEALAELRRMTQWVPISFPPINLSYLPSSTEWPFAIVKAHYWLGIAYEQRGRKFEATEEYRKFLETWKNADFPSPELKDARIRLTRLQGMASR